MWCGRLPMHPPSAPPLSGKKLYWLKMIYTQSSPNCLQLSPGPAQDKTNTDCLTPGQDQYRTSTHDLTLGQDQYRTGNHILTPGQDQYKTGTLIWTPGRELYRTNMRTKFRLYVTLSMATVYKIEV